MNFHLPTFQLTGAGASALLIGAIAMLSPLGNAQRDIYTYESKGGNCGSVGDQNADGYPDFSVGSASRTHDPDGTPGTGDEKPSAGVVEVYSGANGTFLNRPLKKG